MWENWSVRLLRIFMYQGLWKFKNIEVYDFCEISCTGGHENLRKLERSTFENFNVPRVMKIRQNWRILFLRIFMYQGSWKFKKIKGSYFCEVSCIGGHENERKLKRSTFEKFHVLGGHENSTKLKCLYFCEVSCIGGHENARKLKHMIFDNFNVMKMWENWSVQLLRNLMYPGVMKIRQNWSVFIFVKFHVSGVMKMRENWSIWSLRISMYSHENVRKLKPLTFENSNVSGVMKIRQNSRILFLRIFMYRGSWKCEKTEAYDFWEF